MRTQVVLGIYGAWMLAVTAAFYAFAAGHLELWSLLALSSAGAIGAGTVLYRPAHRLPWWLLAVAVTVFAAGDTTYNVLTTILGQHNPFPSLADAFYLAVYPLAAAGLVLLIRHRTGGRDRGSLLDALSLTSALALLSWIFWISPYVHDQQLDWLERATSIAYPLGDVLILATSTRLAITSAGNRAAAMLGVGAVGLLGSDVVYGVGQLDGTWQIGSWYDLGWVVFYIAWGAAALHPSMATVAVPHQQPADGMGVRRMALLMAVSLVAPGVLLADAADGTVEYGPMIAVSSIVLFLLVLARLAGVVARHREAIERERTLRAAGADLVSAAGPDDVAGAVRAAIAQLVPAGAPHAAALLTDAGPGPVARLPTAASRIVRVEDVDPAPIAEVRGFATVLLCPLVLADRPTAGPSMGLLAVAADEAVLITLRGAVEVLASQAALAVERVTLSREVSRRDSEAYFRTLVQNAHDVILIVDDGGRIGYASPSAQTVLGAGCVLGTSVADLLDHDDRAGAQRALLAARGGAGAAVRGYGITRADGRRIDVEVASRDLRDDPTIQGVVLTLRDVTEERRLQQELTHRAFHDPLTGLANRVLFGDRVEQALATAVRDGGMAGLLLVDLDDFKLVNDTMGHGAGDELLVAVADRLTGALRPGDTAARLGGDEFAVLVEGVSTSAEVEEIASRVVDALCVPLDVAGGLTTSVSIGVAVTSEAVAPATEPVAGYADMLRQADLALYDAKGAGKGRWRRYQQGLHLAAVDRLQVRAELERALAEGAFELRYQPVVELDRGRMVGVEALVRWRHPRRGLVPPGDFIPFAEESGLVVPLGAWVLDRALADHREWYRECGTGTPISVSVNVSACQVRSPGFVDGLAAALARWDVPPESLVLEITETSLLADDEQVSADLAALRELGVGIAIDDFGTGYSSLDYIRLHTVDVLKIDRSFIAGMERSGRQAALVGSIVHLAQALGLEIVAEGVETTAQRDALQRAGCQLGQGHLYSVAVPAEEITARLRAGAATVPAGVDAAR